MNNTLLRIIVKITATLKLFYLYYYIRFSINKFKQQIKG